MRKVLNDLKTHLNTANTQKFSKLMVLNGFFKYLGFIDAAGFR
jgi:hypothetical protein